MQITSDLFTFPFKDPQWQKKAFIGMLVMLCYLTGVLMPVALLLLGYFMRALRENIDSEEPRVPDWSDPLALFIDGLQAFVVGFVYALPIVLLLIAFFAIVWGGFMAAAVSGSEDALNAAALSMMLCQLPLMALMLPLSVVSGYLTLVALVRLAIEKKISAALEFGAVWREARTHWRTYVVAYLLLFALQFMLSFVAAISMYTIILACLYPFIMGVVVWYLAATGGALFGMAWRARPSAPPAEGDHAPLPA